MADKKYIRQPQHDLPGKADAWEVAADHLDEDGWTAQRIVFTTPGKDPNKAHNEAKK